MTKMRISSPCPIPSKIDLPKLLVPEPVMARTEEYIKLKHQFNCNRMVIFRSEAAFMEYSPDINPKVDEKVLIIVETGSTYKIITRSAMYFTREADPSN